MKKKIYINLKAVRGCVNNYLGDNNKCNYCFLPIVPLSKLFNGKWYISRENRVDCGFKSRDRINGRYTKGVESYHLACYDKIVFGRVRHSTKKYLHELHDRFYQLKTSHPALE